MTTAPTHGRTGARARSEVVLVAPRDHRIAAMTKAPRPTMVEIARRPGVRMRPPHRRSSPTAERTDRGAEATTANHNSFTPWLSTRMGTSPATTSPIAIACSRSSRGSPMTPTHRGRTARTSSRVPKRIPIDPSPRSSPCTVDARCCHVNSSRPPPASPPRRSNR